MRKSLKGLLTGTVLLCTGLPVMTMAYEVPWSEKYYQAGPSVSEYNELGWFVGGDSRTPADITIPSEYFVEYNGIHSYGTGYSKASDKILTAKSTAVERTAKYTMDSNSYAMFQGYIPATSDVLKLNYAYDSDGTSFLSVVVTDMYDNAVLYNVNLPVGKGSIKFPTPPGHPIAQSLIVSSFALATTGKEKESSSSATFNFELVAPTSDNDEDGVPNESDQCPATPIGAVVEPANGCSIDELVPCNGPRGSDVSWKNHGEYVSNYANVGARFESLGLFSPGEKAGLVKAATASKCGAE